MELFYDFNGFQLLFSAFFRLLGWVWGAVWGIYAISATFSWSFQAFGLGLGCCLGNLCGFSYFFLLFSEFWAGFGVLFGGFLRFQLHKARLLCYQPMAIVHYDNLKIQYFLNKKTKKVYFQKNKNNYCSRFIGAPAIWKHFYPNIMIKGSKGIIDARLHAIQCIP